MVRPYILLGLILKIFGLWSTSQALPASRPLTLFKQPSDERRPHLSCILFGQTACQITCDVLCDLYGCETQARCVDRVSCDCNEIYKVSNRNLTVAQYRNLSLTELWDHNFRSSFASSRTFKRVQRNEQLGKNMTILLRNPHITGEYVKGELEVIRSPWTYVYYLRPNERGNARQIFDENYSFDYDLFNAYFNKTIGSIFDKKHDEIESMQNPDALPSLLRYLRDNSNVRYLVSQVLWFPDNNLLTLINDYSRRTKYDAFNHVNNASVVERENAAFQSFKSYVGHAVDNLVDQVYGKVQEMKQKLVLPQLLSYINDKADVKNIISLLLMFPNDSLYSLMRTLVQQNRNDTYNVHTYRHHQTVNPQEVDELVCANVLEKLLRIKTAPVQQPTTATSTTTTQPPPTTTSVPFHVHIQRLIKDTFGSAKADDKEPKKDKKKHYPELQQLLVQLMEYLVNSGNNKIENKP